MRPLYTVHSETLELSCVVASLIFVLLAIVLFAAFEKVVIVVLHEPLGAPGLT